VAVPGLVGADGAVHFLADDASDSATVLTYHPDTDTWSTASYPGLDPARTTLDAVFGERLVLQERIHPVGQQRPFGTYDESDSRLVFADPDGGAVEDVPAPPLPSVDSTQVVVDGDQLYVVGLDLADDAAPRIAVFDDEGGWRRLPDARAPRFRNRVLPVDGVLVDVAPGGGEDPTDATDAWETYGAVLDPATGTWSDLPAGRVGGPSVLDVPIAAGERIFTADGLLLDVANRSWSAVPPPPGSVGDGATAVWAGDRLFVWGGGAGDGGPQPAAGQVFVLGG
jgi:hypothetical protein